MTTPNITLRFVAPKGLKPSSTIFAGTFEVVPTGFAGIQIQDSDNTVGAMMDGSGSMKVKKIAEACEALIKLITETPEHMKIFVVVFGNSGRVLIPVQLATAANKKRMIAAVQKFQEQVDDGESESTHMGKGFTVLLSEIEKNLKGSNVTVVAYTDGVIDDPDAVDTQMDRLEALRRAGYSIKGHLRGIGTGWDPRRIDKVSQAFHGTTDLVGGAKFDMAKDLSVILEEAASQVVSNVELTIWSPKESKLVEISQQNPVQVPLTSSVIEDPRDAKKQWKVLGLGSLGNEPVRYFFHFELNPHEPGDAPVAAAKIGLRYRLNGQDVEIPPTKLSAEWTNDEKVYSDIPPETRRAFEEKDTKRMIEDADADRQAGRVEQATRKYADALFLAEATGNTELAGRIAEVVHVDQATKRVTPKDMSEQATKRVLAAARTTRRVGDPAASSN